MTLTNQREPNRWMVLAIAQSMIWLFGLPILCRQYWDVLFASYSNATAECIIMFTPIPYLLGYMLVMLPIYFAQHPFFEQYKIQKDRPWPWLDEREKVRQAFWALSKRSLKLSSFNLFILLPILGYGKIYMVELLGLSNPSAFSTDDEAWPSILKNCRDVLMLSVVHEFGFYSTHRLMHTYASLYKYHKVHHEYKCNTVLAAQHNHPVDYILSIAVPALLAIAVVDPHSSTMFQWILWTVHSNLDDHVGYSFPWSPIR